MNIASEKDKPSRHARLRPAHRQGWLQRLTSGLHLPARCAVCHGWPRELICAECIAAQARPVLRCPGCAIRLPEDRLESQFPGKQSSLTPSETPMHGGAALAPDVPDATENAPPLCSDCETEPLDGLDAVHAALSYQWPWQGCIDAFKFGRQPGWAAALAERMAAQPAIVQAVQQCDVLVPLPLHRERLAERGFSQTLLLARTLRRQVARDHGLAPQQARLRHDWLVRTRHTVAQSTLPLEERLRNLQDAFAAKALHAPRLYGARAVLVDDVMTSGTTLQEAARALQRAGCATVVGVVLARTEKPSFDRETTA